MGQPETVLTRVKVPTLVSSVRQSCGTSAWSSQEKTGLFVFCPDLLQFEAPPFVSMVTPSRSAQTWSQRTRRSHLNSKAVNPGCHGHSLFAGWLNMCNNIIFVFPFHLTATGLHVILRIHDLFFTTKIRPPSLLFAFHQVMVYRQEVPASSKRVFSYFSCINWDIIIVF